MEKSSISDFMYHLHDTVILLGGGEAIANLLLQLNEIDESDVDFLRQFNINLQESLKDKLVNINKVNVQVAG